MPRLGGTRTGPTGLAELVLRPNIAESWLMHSRFRCISYWLRGMMAMSSRSTKIVLLGNS